MKKAITKVALKLGGFDKVRKLTISQFRAIAEEIAEDKKTLYKLHGFEIKEQKQEKMQSFSEAFKAMQG